MSATYTCVYSLLYYVCVPLANLLFRYTIPFVPVSSGDEHIIIIIMTIICRCAYRREQITYILDRCRTMWSVQRPSCANDKDPSTSPAEGPHPK